MLLAATLALLTLGVGAGAAADWPTYAGGPERQFFDRTETQIDAGSAGTLEVRWGTQAEPRLHGLADRF